MTLDEIDIKVGKGIGQIMSVLGMLAGWGTAVSGAIATMTAALPKNATTIAVIGFGSLIGSASNWLLVHGRVETIKAKTDVITAHLYHAGQQIEASTGLDVPVVEADAVPPTLPRI